MASARWRIVLDQPSPAARPGSRVRGSCGARPLRQSYIKPHCPQCQPVSRKLLLWQPPLRALSGEGNRLYAKLPSLGTVAQPSALPGRWHALRAAVCAPLWLSWRCGIGQALRAVWLVSGLRPVMWCVPPPTLVLRRCAASALRAGLPVRPPWGLPQPARVRFCLCYKFDSCSRSEYEGHRPTRPVSQRDRWLTFGSYVCDSCEVCQNKIVSSIAAGFGKSSYIRPYIEHPRKKPAIF